MNILPNLTMSHLTIHKHREPKYLRAYNVPLFPFSLIPFPFYEADTFTTVERTLQITPFYAKQTQFKPNTNPIKPN
jgi:hypothetical protein